MKPGIRLVCVIVLVVALFSNSVAASSVKSKELTYYVDNAAARSMLS